jgi:Protein of unknown function (DUF2510)
MSTPPAPAGWYLDPSDSSRERWWDGTGWAEQSRPFVGAMPAPAREPAPAPQPPPPPPLHPAGWYPDAQGTVRYWDGHGWTEHVAAPTRKPPAFWVAIAAAALMVLGGLGPWATALRVVDVSGTNGDGWLVIGAAVVAAGVLFASPRDAGPIVALLAAIGGAIVGFVDLSDINSRGALVQPAWGIYMVLLSSGTLFVASLILLLQKRRPGRA